MWSRKGKKKTKMYKSCIKKRVATYRLPQGSNKSHFEVITPLHKPLCSIKARSSQFPFVCRFMKMKKGTYSKEGEKTKVFLLLPYELWPASLCDKVSAFYFILWTIFICNSPFCFCCRKKLATRGACRKNVISKISNKI